jgi:diguanylate cyclase (GGDEF)-like protein
MSTPKHDTPTIEALSILGIVDSVPEQAFDDLALIAATLCDTPMAAVSLISGDRHQFKSQYGMTLEQLSQDATLCARVSPGAGMFMEVADAAADGRFANSPLVVGEPGIRFCAGVPLVTESGRVFGTLCVFDHESRVLGARQRAALEALARQAVAKLKLRSMHGALQQALAAAHNYQAELERYQAELRRLNTQLQAQATTDPLTGLYNRLALAQQLNQAVAQAERSGSMLSLLFIDVDQFKSYNDTFGHLAGDEALLRLAEIIRETAREADAVARYGGEEFVVVLPASSVTGALALAERIRGQVEMTQWSLRRLTISVGVVTRQAGHPRFSAQQLFEDADQAMYRAKGAGRNCVAVA